MENDMLAGLCQNCLCVRYFHYEEEAADLICDCGGDFCACPECQKKASLLLSDRPAQAARELINLSDEQRAFSWMIEQYAPMLCAYAERVGWEALLQELREIVTSTPEKGTRA